ncbi:MAG: tRNA (N(6)-L-threonylcarbamoyladenosine(37)-C(2))-methylthiotransferase MtaB [Clostridia bacterium]|nr:tRNA (N(6)-L-threonylcarbamoyladenosine(37)-C(2))-methylthiotransferase MtaB [Clostridia bacterium]
MRIAFYTLGCKVNQYDTQMMREKLEQHGHVTVRFEQEADCYIINTCTVTNMSDKKSRQIISKCKKMNRDAIIVVCGCYAQISPDETASLSGVDVVIGTANRKNIAEYIQTFLEKKAQIIEVPDLSGEKILCSEQISRFDEKTRAILKVEDGCRNFCSYCAIPFARGPIRSKSQAEIDEELRNLQSNGYKEVVLTGIHLASYGKDFGNTDLADVILQTDSFGFDRIRLGSLEPKIITEEFLQKISSAKSLMPSFHLSLQSGCDTVLQRMNRHYTTNEYRLAVSLLREYYPNCAITTDIIVGFPGETEEEFNKTLQFAKEISFAKIHIFPYSPRKGTKAAYFTDQINGNVKSLRCKQLEQVEIQSRNAFLEKHIDQILPVLFEQNKDDYWEGYTENYLPVFVSSEKPLDGVLQQVKITKVENDTLFSEFL